jgi:hypothetical protein
MSFTLSANFFTGTVLVSAALFLVFMVLLYTGSKSERTRSYARIAMWVFFLSLGITVLYFTKNPQVLNLTVRANHFFGGMVAVSFFFFTLSYKEEKLATLWRTSIALFETALLFMYLFTNLVIRDAYFGAAGPLSNGWHFGPLGFLFQLNYLGLFCLGFKNLYDATKIMHSSSELAEIKYFGIVSGVGVILPTTVGLVLPVFGIFNYFWLTPVVGLLWLATTMYVIIRHQIFNVRIILAEFLVIALMLLTFINIFVSNK